MLVASVALVLCASAPSSTALLLRSQLPALEMSREVQKANPAHIASVTTNTVQAQERIGVVAYPTMYSVSAFLLLLTLEGVDERRQHPYFFWAHLPKSAAVHVLRRDKTSQMRNKQLWICWDVIQAQGPCQNDSGKLHAGLHPVVTDRICSATLCGSLRLKLLHTN